MKNIYKWVLSLCLIAVAVVGVFAVSNFDSKISLRAQISEQSTPYNNAIKGISVTANKFATTDLKNSMETIPNGGFVMLNTVMVDYSKPKTVAIFEIKPDEINTNTSIILSKVSVNAYLNGRAISLGDAVIEDVQEDSGEEIQRFAFKISGDSQSIRYYTGEYVTNYEGLYEFYFYLNIKNKNNSTVNQYPLTGFYSYSFYVFEEKNFNKESQLPKITELTETSNVDGYTAVKYYNYKYKDNKINFPMLSFDPERYEITLERRHNAISTAYKSKFVYTDKTWQSQNKKTDYGILYFIEQTTGEFISFKLERSTGITGTGLFTFNEANYYDEDNILKNLDGTTGYSEPLMYNVGTYTYTAKYQSYITIDGEQSGSFMVQEEYGNMVCAYERIYVYGQMAYYANVNGDDSFDDFYYGKTAMRDNSASDIDADTLNALKSDYKNFVSTNQAPVWFEYVGSLSSTSSSTSKVYYCLDPSKNDSWTESTYGKNTYFSTAGYYVVVIYYSNEIIEEAGTSYQVFTFALTNKTPNVKVLTQDSEGEYTKSLNSDGFTRYNVKIQVDKPGIFDNAIATSYYRSATFGDNLKDYTYFTPELMNGSVSTNEDEYFTFTEAGKYYVKINYTRQSYSLYVFTIDKDELDDFVVFRGVSPFNVSSSGVDLQYRLNSNYYSDVMFTNKPFTVYVNEKPSHSIVTGTFYTFDINYEQELNQTEILSSTDGKILYNFANYVATNASSRQNYSNTRLAGETSELISSAYIFNTQKLYVFEFTDASGYSYMHALLLDKSTINIIQTDKDNIKQTIDEFNVVSDETHMYWGTHKSIKFPNEYSTEVSGSTDNVLIEQVKRNKQYRYELSNAYPDVFTTLLGTYQMLIPITDVKIVAKTLEDELLSDVYLEDTKQLYVYPDLTGYNNIATKYKGEKYYYITLTDASGNTLEYKIEMNMDRSRGMMFTTKDIDDGYKDADYRLVLEKAGSLGQLIFEWQDSKEDIYAIDTVSYEFYPLVYNTALSTYPYDNVPLVQKVIYDSEDEDVTEWNLIEGTTTYYSKILNMVPTTVNVYNELTGNIETQTQLISRPGRYVITRTYAGGDEDAYNNTGDSKVRTYVFYSDNNPIIGTPDYSDENSKKDFGESIKIYLGKDEVAFDEFYRESIYSSPFIHSQVDGTYEIEYVDVALITNLLPIKIKVPKSKYSYVNGAIAYSSSVPKTFNLKVTIKYYKDSNFVEEYVYENVDSNGWLVIDNLFKEGVYVLSIQDNAVPPNNEISPILGAGNKGTTFGFEIQHSKPEGTILTAKNYNNLQDSIHMTRGVDSEGNYVYNWLSTTNINTTNLVVERRAKTSSGNYGDYEVCDYKMLNNSVGVDSSVSQYSLYLPAYGVVSNTIYTYQYKITYHIGEDVTTYSVISPTMDDLNAYTEIGQSITSTTKSYIIFAFSDPADKYYAKIDESDIVITRAKKLANGTYSSAVELVNGVDYVVEKRWKSLDSLYYTISLEANTSDENGIGNEYIYQIKYHYVGDRNVYIIEQGDEIKDFYSNEVSLVVDRTPPSSNLKRIATTTVNMTALSNNGIGGDDYFKSTYYKAEDGLYYFANTGLFDFAIDTNFRFTRPNVSKTLLSKDHEAKSIYFRKYDKYNTTSLGQKAFQCLVPGDPEYYSGTTTRLRFNASDSENWEEFGYDLSISFYDYMYERFAGNASGYYEIVEIDEAGNHTVYTIIVNTNYPSIEAEVNNSVGVKSVKEFTYLNADVDSIDSLTITNVLSLDKWFTLTFDSATYNITPDTDLSAILVNINKTFVKNTAYTLKISNRFGSEVVFNIRIGDTEEKITILSVVKVNQDDDVYKVLLSNDTDVIRLLSLVVYRYEDGGFRKLVDELGDPVDALGNKLDVIDKQDRVFEFTKGIYRFVMEDNFRQDRDAYSEDISIGLAGNFELNFVEDYIRKDGVRYTSGEVIVSAPLESFAVEITKDGKAVSLDNYIDGSNMLSITLSPAVASSDSDVVSGAKNSYKIKVTDIVTQQVTYHEFVIYNIFPAVNAVDNLGLSMNAVVSTARNNVSTFTSKAVILEWSIPDTTFGYSVMLLRYTDNSDIPTASTAVSGNTVTAKTEGVYELKFTTNELKSSRSIYFMIKDSTISMYQVYESLPNGKQNVVLPAEEFLDISDDIYVQAIKKFIGTDRTVMYPYTDGRLMVKNYFSCYNFIVEVEGDKNLRTNFNDLTNEIIYYYDDVTIQNNFQTQIIVVYGVSPYSYIEVFAITKVPSNTKFLSDLGYTYTNAEDSRTVTIPTDQYYYLAIYDAPIVLHWTNYYGVSQNKVYMKYYYNDNFIGSTYGDIDGDTSTFNISLPGEYKFEFYDLAGNKQTFGTGSVGYLTVLLKSEVVYYINNDTPIYGAVYNNDAVLAIPDRNTYATNTLSVSILRNGKEYTLNPNNGVYTFTEQGVYEVRLNASVLEGESTKALKEVVTTFSIIKSDEARFAYEFANMNGYVITKIVKNNVDITEVVRGDNSAIYSLLLSEDSYGSGKYRIYVQGNPMNELLKVQNFDFYVWVNSEIPVISSSIEHGTVSVAPIEIKFNPSVILEQIGNSKIYLNNTVLFEINSSVVNETRTLRITNAGDHYITLKTDAGNTVLSFKVIKKDPLNTVSIIIIVVAVIIVITGSIIFFRMRVRMKIK